MKKVNRVLASMAGIIMIITIPSFASFILEESLQTVMFGSWQASSTQNWELLLEAADVNKGINTTLKILNYSIGWINPFSFFAYKNYAKSMDYWIKTTKVKVFANAPELFIGRTISIKFIPRKITHTPDGRYMLTDGRVGIISRSNNFKQRMVTGIVEKQGKIILIKGKIK